MQLRHFDIDHFLTEYWQKAPLLIRNPWDHWRNPLEPDELAGLACEDAVESRLIEQTGQAPQDWSVENGPLAEERFTQLGALPWTLLVQAVDQIVPDIAALIEPFRFIPDWRIDDVMVSYANNGGGVGAHFDQYDVFLIQGLGRRRWQVGAQCDDRDALLAHDELRLLAKFEAQQEWVLEPGDILYVPPGFAHNGVAVGDDCMTYSMGFRAPSRSELIADWSDDLVAEMAQDDRYVDPGLTRQDHPGEITPDAIDRLHQMITEKMDDRAAFARWFGRYNSTPKYPDMDWRPEYPVTAANLQARLAQGDTLLRNAASRFSFIRENADTLLLFADGECFPCTGDTQRLALELCVDSKYAPIRSDDLSRGGGELLAQLFNQGSLFWANGDA